MVFLSSYSAVAKLSYLIADSVILGTVGWKVLSAAGYVHDCLAPAHRRWWSCVSCAGDALWRARRRPPQPNGLFSGRLCPCLFRPAQIRARGTAFALCEAHLLCDGTAQEVNRIFPFEVAMHVGLTAWLFMHLELWLVLVNLPYLAWTVSMYMDKSYFVDASQVYTPAFKKSSQTKILIAAGFFSIM